MLFPMLRRFLSVLVPIAPLAASGERVSYAYEVRPILSDKCFACHGPDAAKREAGLRLDTAEGAMAPLKDSAGSALVPGDPEKSLAWQRIISKDPEQVMPPPSSHLALSAEEQETLHRWIGEGAEYEPHWSFQPLPESVPVPRPKDTAWPKSDTDRFIRARLEKEGLAPSPPADPLRWLRRATLDLTGLPPSPAEIAAFQAAARNDLTAA